MNKTLYLIFICLLLCAGTHLVAQTFDYNRVSGHPRLLMKQGEEQQIRESLKDNPEMQRVYKQIVGEADRLLVCPTLTYKKEGRRLLAVSREALKRIFDLSFVYRMTGEDNTACVPSRRWCPSALSATGTRLISWMSAR